MMSGMAAEIVLIDRDELWFAKIKNASVVDWRSL
jgi:hypothetical protein